MDISLIAIIETTTKGIGKDGNLLRSFKQDLKRFKSLTLNNIVVMGSTTFFKDLKGVPLKDRINIVLTSKLENKKLFDNVIYLNACSDFVIEYINSNFPDKDIFIIGGQNIYEQFLSYVNILYITEYEDKLLKPDKFFPNINDLEWNLYETEELNELTFKIYKRVNN